MSVNQARSRPGNATKKAKSQGLLSEVAPSVVDARRQLAEAKINEFVARTVATAPPLTEEQLTRLAGLFLPGRR